MFTRNLSIFSSSLCIIHLRPNRNSRARYPVEMAAEYAAIARAHGASVSTRNTADYAVAGWR